MEFVLYNIEFPLVLGLVDTELEGVTLNVLKWEELIVKNKKIIAN